MPTPSHRERTKSEEKETRRSRKAAAKRGFITVAVLAILIVAVRFLTGALSDRQEEPAAASSPTPIPGVAADSAWKLTVVSAASPLPRDFTVNLEALDADGEIKLDTRILPALKQLLFDANDAGAGFTVCSGYRSVSKQEGLHRREIQRYEARGLDADAARGEAERYVQPPGGSEHHTGLAIDVLALGESELSEDFADTEAGKWLAEHAPEYGFILRYPEGKEELTGIAWEPWHFRYVGSEAARIIAANGICLEEYVADPEAYRLPEPSPQPEKEATP